MVETSNGEVYEAWQSVLSAHSEDAIALQYSSTILTKRYLPMKLPVDCYMDMIGAEYLKRTNSQQHRTCQGTLAGANLSLRIVI